MHHVILEGRERFFNSFFSLVKIFSILHISWGLMPLKGNDVLDFKWTSITQTKCCTNKEAIKSEKT